MVGCRLRNSCYLKDLDCLFAQKYLCVHIETVEYLERQKKIESKRILDSCLEDIKLQIEWQR